VERATSRVLTLLVLLAACPSGLAAKKQKNSDQELFKQAKAVEETSGGNAAAEFLLGDSYDHGRGVPQDYSEALQWYLKAANRGYVAAQEALSQLYYFHSPVCPGPCMQETDTNQREAYFWVDVALASTDQPVTEGGLSKETRRRALLLKLVMDRTLPQDQIAAAQSKATKWFAEHRKAPGH
jgi:TPR repeat protein